MYTVRFEEIFVFVPHRLAEIYDQSGLAGQDYKGWRFVEKIRVEPWFHVTAVRPFQTDAGTEVILIDGLETLKSFMRYFNEAYQLSSIQVVTPGWMNGSNTWKMEPLAELRESDDGITIQYTTRDSAEYFFPNAAACPPEGCRVQIFPHP